MGRTSKVLGLFLFALLGSTLASAQAWTPPKGEGFVSVSFLDTLTKHHFLSDGTRLDIGHIRSLALIPEVDFGLSDRLAATFTLPIVAAKYYGPDPHQIPYDNGNYHGGSADFKLGLRYRWLRRPLMVTPFVTFGVPSRDYVFFAHSAVGTGQRELAFGVAVGHQFETGIPNAYYQAAYSYGIVESADNIRPNRNHIGLEGGYIIGHGVTVRGVGEAQVTHGGLNIPQDFNLAPPPDERFIHHDQTANVNFLNLGVGVDLPLNKDWSAYGTVYRAFWGENGHAIEPGITVGVSRRFHMPWARAYRKVVPSAIANPAENDTK